MGANTKWQAGLDSTVWGLWCQKHWVLTPSYCPSCCYSHSAPSHFTLPPQGFHSKWWRLFHSCCCFLTRGYCFSDSNNTTFGRYRKHKREWIGFYKTSIIPSSRENLWYPTWLATHYWNCRHLDWSEVKASACNAGDLGLIPGLGRSPGEGNGNPLQYSCLENPMNRGAWWAIVHGVTKSRTRLSDFTSLH